jgi:NAD(P)-dependent dehydrogenase (short-subunit alcohol dehydrogenase family)
LAATLSRVLDFGARFLIVAPGAFRTGLFAPKAAYLSEPMPEYEAAVGAARSYVHTGAGSRPGDPAKAAEAIIAAIDSEDPPLRLVLGEDAVVAIGEELPGQQLQGWGPLDAATAFDVA